MKKVLDGGEGYKVRATRKPVGTFEVVAVDWKHPNYGYFADAMIWVWPPHMDRWIPFHVARWTEKYDTVDSFLRNHPAFSKLFEDTDLLDIRRGVREKLKRALK